MPWYGRTAFNDLTVDFRGVMESAGTVKTELNGVPVHFVKNRTYFETDYRRAESKPPFAHPHLFRKDYSNPYVDSEAHLPFYDDALRFAFFSEACLRLIDKMSPTSFTQTIGFLVTCSVGWALLSRRWHGWRAALHVVQPATVLAWHRRGFRLSGRGRVDIARGGRGCQLTSAR